MPGQTQPHVPALPLFEEIRRRGGRAAVFRGRNDRGRVDRALHRGQQSGYFTTFTADRLEGDLLGCHPADLWGPIWWEVA